MDKLKPWLLRLFWFLLGLGIGVFIELETVKSLFQ